MANDLVMDRQTVSFKFLGGAASWLVACKSNKYEVLVHSENKSLDLSMGG